MSKKIYTIFTLILIVAATQNLLARGGKSKVAIIPFSALNAPNYYGDTIRNALEYKLTESGQFTVLERQNIMRIMEEKKLKGKKLSNVAKIIAADYLITGSIEIIENYTLRIKVVSGETGKILFVYSQQYKNKNDYSYIIKTFSRQLIKDLKHYADSTAIETRKLPVVNLGLSAGFLYPLGVFNDVADYGYGITLNCNIEKGNYNFLSEIGYLSYYTHNSIKELASIPIMLGIGYKINYNYRFYFMPYITTGIQYIIAEKYDNSIKEPELSIKCGLYSGVNVSPNASIYLNTGFLYINESDNPIIGITANIGILYKI